MRYYLNMNTDTQQLERLDDGYTYLIDTATGEVLDAWETEENE